MNNELDVRSSVKAAITGFEMKPRSMEEALKFCDMMAHSDLIPNGYKGKPGNIMVAIQMGLELGMTPMRALRSIAVINGRATMWGDDVLAMVLNSPICEYVDESESTDKVGICKTKRKGSAEQVSTFTLEDAKRAGLLGKQGPWQTNTSRMLKLRARGFALRDTFADVLAGLVSAEEALDLPRVEPEAGLPTMLEAQQPPTLKEKLKAKVEQTEQPATDTTAARQGDGLDETAHAEITAAPASQDAPATSEADDPAEPYRVKIRTAHNSAAVNKIYKECPEALKQDLYRAYSERLKQLRGK